MMTRINLSKLAALAVVLLTSFSASASDFTYTITNPTYSLTGPYVSSYSNLEFFAEGGVYGLKPDIGAATMGDTLPGTIIYHFNFSSDSVADAHLFLNMPTFHWAYSEGHSFLYGSTDGSSWLQLMEVTPPEFGLGNPGVYNADLPSPLLGGNDIWLKAELYSYGSAVNNCAACTNTAQLFRYNVPTPNTTFRLDVNFAVAAIPEPETYAMLLVGLGLLGFMARRRKQKETP